MKAYDIVKALQRRHGAAGRSWALLPELRVGTGYKNLKANINPEQRIDAWAICLYPSKGLCRVAYEIKVSRSDFLHEIKNPEKRLQAMQYSNQFYFATPKGLVKPEEIPTECGLVEIDEDGSSRYVVGAPYRDTEPDTWIHLLAAIARRAAKAEARIENPELITG